MRQFITGTDTDFADLEQRTRSNCITFGDQEMPPGTTPARARIGFDIAPQSGEAILLINRGLSYNGPSNEVREWFERGEKRFSTFADLRSWMRTELAGCYRPVPRTPRHNLPVTPQLSNLSILCTNRSHLQVTMDYVGERYTSQGNGFSEYRCRLCGCRKGFVRDRVDGQVKQLFAVAR